MLQWTGSHTPPRSVNLVIDEAIAHLRFQYLRYLVGPSTPLSPIEPFTVVRLRSNAERLYTVARPTWEGAGQTVGNLCLWKDKLKTSLVLSVSDPMETVYLTK